MARRRTYEPRQPRPFVPHPPSLDSPSTLANRRQRQKPADPPTRRRTRARLTHTSTRAQRLTGDAVWSLRASQPDEQYVRVSDVTRLLLAIAASDHRTAARLLDG